MKGHHYVTLEKDGKRIQFAFPAEVIGGTDAIKAAERIAPGWTWPLGAITWRASFCQHCLPSNSQPDYAKHNRHAATRALVNTGVTQAERATPRAA